MAVREQPPGRAGGGDRNSGQLAEACQGLAGARPEGAATGQHQGNPRLRLRPVKVEVLDGDLVITLPEGTRERIARSRSQQPREAR